MKGWTVVSNGESSAAPAAAWSGAVHRTATVSQSRVAIVPPDRGVRGPERLDVFRRQAPGSRRSREYAFTDPRLSSMSQVLAGASIAPGALRALVEAA